MQALSYITALLILPCIAFGQRYNENRIAEDFNNDSFVDSLICYYSGGSGFGGKYCNLVNGKTKDTISVNNFGCFCQIKSIVIIPDKLNQSFKDVLSQHFLPQLKGEPDPSLNWVIGNYFRKSVTENLKYFEKIVHKDITWYRGEPKAPDMYAIEISADTLAKLEQKKEYANERAWLIYYGHNHDTLVKIQYEFNNIRILITKHGVVLQKADSYAWIFITDFDMTGGPEKLRWKSILNLTPIQNFLIMEQNGFSGPKNIFIIDMNSGKWGKLSNKALRYEDNYLKLHIDSNTITVIDDERNEQIIVNKIEFDHILKEFQSF